MAPDVVSVSPMGYGPEVKRQVTLGCDLSLVRLG